MEYSDLGEVWDCVSLYVAILGCNRSTAPIHLYCTYGIFFILRDVVSAIYARRWAYSAHISRILGLFLGLMGGYLYDGRVIMLRHLS